MQSFLPLKHILYTCIIKFFVKNDFLKYSKRLNVIFVYFLII